MYTWDQREIDRYDYEVDRRKVYEGQLESARDQGIEKGFDEGFGKGFGKGRAEGELQAKLTIARTMFQQGMPLETIAAITQLPLDLLKESLT
jgi:predicted transposase/invertase (TIGR01784 family)